jgi:hypothetical protein
MPKVDNVGFSDNTVIKIEVLSKILDMHFQITQAVIRKHPTFHQIYRYIDATAGKGYSPLTSEISKIASFKPPIWSGINLIQGGQILGSPLVFLHVAHSSKIKIAYQADLVECEDINYQELRKTVSDYCRQNDWRDCDEQIKFHSGYYQVVVPELLKAVDEKEFGLFYIDPSGEPPDFELISEITTDTCINN